MSFIGNMLNPSQSTGFQAQSAPVMQLTDPNQIAAANQQANSALGQQQAFANAVAAQGGLQNQSNVFNQQQGLANQLAANNGAGNQALATAQGQGLGSQLLNANGVGAQQQALGQSQGIAGQLAGANGVGATQAALAGGQNLAGQLAAANGVGTQGAAVSGLQNLANQQAGTAQQYQNIANGTGPNPAMAALNQATGTNVANQAALMAGQRGAGANVGLLARQAAQQGANTQQQAVGQGATMQAQQQLGALSGLTAQQQAQAATQQAIGGLGTTQVGQQAGLLGQNAGVASGLTGQALGAAAQNASIGAGLTGQAQNQIAQNMGQANSQIAQQQAQQGQLAGLSSTQAAQQQAALSGLNQNAQALQAAQLGAGASTNQANISNAAQQNSANAGIAQANIGAGSNLLGNLTGGLLNGIAGTGAGSAGAEGGKVTKKGFERPNYDQGGAVAPIQTATTPSAANQAATMAAKPAPVQQAQPTQSRALSFLQGTNKGSSGGWNSVGQGLGSLIKSGYNAVTGPGAGTVDHSAAAQQISPYVANPNTPKDTSGSQMSGLDSESSDSGTPQMAKGGKVPALVSPGERYLPPKEVKKVVEGEKSPMEAGEKIPGKPKVGGAKNSYANDTVPKTLDEGGVVLPRSVTQAKNPHWAAHKFVSDLMAQGKLKKGLK